MKKLFAIMLTIAFLFGAVVTPGSAIYAAETDLLSAPAFPGAPAQVANPSVNLQSLPYLYFANMNDPAVIAYIVSLSGSGASVMLSVEGEQPAVLPYLGTGVTASLNPGYALTSSGTNAGIYFFNEIFSDVSKLYTITFKIPGYEDKVADQYWDTVQIPLSIDNVVADSNFSNIGISLRAANDGWADFSWNLRNLNWSPYYAWEFLESLDHILVNGQKLYQDNGFTVPSNYSTLSMPKIYGVYFQAVYKGTSIYDFNISLEYSEVVLVMKNGGETVLSENRPGGKTPPMLVQENLYIAGIDNINSGFQIYYPKSNDFRAVWIAYNTDMPIQYNLSIYSVIVNGEDYPRLTDLPGETNPSSGFYLHNAVTAQGQTSNFFSHIALGLNPFEGDYDIVIKARGYEDLEISIRNEPEEDYNIFAPGFRLGLEYRNGLEVAPEGVDDSPTGEIEDFYLWDISLIQSLPFLRYNAEMKSYFDSVTDIRAYTDLYPGGRDLVKVSEADVQLPYSTYSYYLGGDRAAMTINEQDYSTRSGPWNMSLYIRTNGEYNSYLGDPSADKINRLVITAAGYETYDATFTHGTLKYPVYISPVGNIIRNDDTNKLNVQNLVFTFSPEAEFENGVSGVRLVWEGGARDLDPGQYSLGSGALTIVKEVFEDPSVPVLQTIYVVVSSDGYMESAARQMIDSTNPYAHLSDRIALLIRYPGMTDIYLSEKEIYNFIMQHNGFYVLDNMPVYVIDGKLVYPGLTEEVIADVSALGQKYYYYSYRRGVDYINFLGIDVVQLFWEKFGVDLYALARDPEAPNFIIGGRAVDNWGSGSTQTSFLRAETAYFTDTSFTGTAIPQPPFLINYQYEDGTWMENSVVKFDTGKSSKYMFAKKGLFKNYYGMLEIVLGYGNAVKTKSVDPVVAEINSVPVGGIAEIITAYVGDQLTFSNNNSIGAVYFSVAWDGEIPGDPIPSYRNLYQYNGKIQPPALDLFNRGGIATVKFMYNSSLGALYGSGGEINSNVVAYTFSVGKQSRSSLPRVSSAQPGEVLGTTAEMEFHTDPNAADGWIQAGELSTCVVGGTTYYFRYAENDRYYAGASVAIEVVQTNKQFQSVPTNLEATGPSAPGENGAISGTNSSMEFSSNGSSWTVAGEGVTSLPSGTYYIRYAGTVTYLPGSSILVTVPVYVKDYEGVLFEILDTRGGKNELYQVSGDLAAKLARDQSYKYTTVNTYGTPKRYDDMEGVEITPLFEALDIEMKGSDLLQFISSDNYSKTVLWDYLTAERYYYPNLPNTFVNGQAPASAYVNPIPVPAIISFNYEGGTLMIGQNAPHEQTNDVFAQYIASYNKEYDQVGQIILVDGNNAKFPTTVTVSPASGTTVNSGRQVSLAALQTLLGYSDGYIYYTTDGSEPTLNSRLYNYNTYETTKALVFNPTISAADADPFSGIVTLKVKVFGQSKYPSDTMTFIYYVDDYQTAKPAVTFVYNDGVTPNERIEVEAGDKAVEPKLPVRSGWLFRGWLLDGSPYDFSAPVTKDITLTASWQYDSGDLLFEIIDRRGGVNNTYQVKEGMAQYATRGEGYYFSAVNTVGNPDGYTEMHNGPQLTLLFEALGISMSGSDLLRIVAADNFQNTVRWDWLTAERYYYPNLPASFPGFNGQAPPSAYENPVSVPAIISMGYDGGTLMFGQQAPHEQTKFVFAKNMLYNGSACGQIFITDGDDSQYDLSAMEAIIPAPDSTVPDGTQITIDGIEKQSRSFGFVYYTTDGSEPTLSSKLYNYNSYYASQPAGGDVFKPVITSADADPYTGEVTLKIKAFGIEKLPGDTMTVSYKVEGYEITTPIVTFIYGDGSTPNAEEKTSFGDTVAKPADPVWNIHQFLGWYDGETLFDFNTPVAAHLTLTARWADGSGSNPFCIAGMDDLRWMSDMVGGTSTRTDYRNKYYILTADIVYDDGGFIPIGGTSSAAAFVGTLDGQGHIISGLNISGASNIGLFAYISGATVKNLGLLDVNISGSGSNIGAIVGQTAGQSGSRSARIENCFVTGTISGVGAVGGIAGNLGGYSAAAQYTATLANCYFDGGVSATAGSAAGLVGTVSAYSRIENSYALGTVSAGNEAGGLAGSLSANVALIDNLALNKSVAATAGSGRAGRVTGYLNGGALTTCYAWEDMDLSGAITNAGAAGSDLSAEIISDGTGIPIVFKSAPWEYTAGGLPTLSGLGGQSGNIPSYLRLTVIRKGDINGDGEIDIFDVRVILDHINGITMLESGAIAAADVTGDGEIDIFDVRAILDHIYGIKLIGE